MGNTGESSDRDGSTVEGTATPVAVGAPTADVFETAPTAPTPPGVLDRVGAVLDEARRALARVTSRRALGWVLAVGWVLWVVVLWVAQPRLVPQDVLADDLAGGRVTAYRVVTVEEDHDRGPVSPYRIDVSPASDAQDGELDGAANGRPVTVAYWVDARVAGLRVLDTNGLSSDTTAAEVARLGAAGVPEADAAVLSGGTPAGWAYDAGVILVVVTTLVVILGPRPRRGTRWFWFWIVGGPLAVGVPIFAVAELLRPRFEPADTVHPPGVAGRRSGLTGFALSVVLSFAGAGLLIALTAWSPIWFIRG